MITDTKAQWISEFKTRIKVWIIRTIKFLETISLNITTKNIVFQLTKSATSVGANHRASCRARSTNEYYSITGSTNFKLDAVTSKANHSLVIKEFTTAHPIYNEFKEIFNNGYNDPIKMDN